jgi:hypothetical protein
MSDRVQKRDCVYGKNRIHKYPNRRTKYAYQNYEYRF